MFLRKISFLAFLISISLSTAFAECKQNIILLHHPSRISGGLKNELMSCAENFIKNGHPTQLIVYKDSPTQYAAALRNIPYYKSVFKNAEELAETIIKLSHTNAPTIVIGFNIMHIDAFKIIKSMGLPNIRCVVKLHSPEDDIDKHVIKNQDCIDGIICLNKTCFNALQSKKSKRLIHPFFSMDSLLDYKPADDDARASFFKKLRINANNKTMLCMIANFYIGQKNNEHKSHDFLLEALKILVEKYNDTFFCMLAGTGPGESSIKKMILNQNLGNYVRCIGYIGDIPQLLSYTDIHLLSSKKEPFGIVHAEAGLMQVPSVGATGTGAEDIIVDGQTGLIFENGNADDLALKLHTLIINQELRKKLGAQAQPHIIDAFDNDKKYKAHKDFFDALYKS